MFRLLVLLDSLFPCNFSSSNAVPQSLSRFFSGYFVTYAIPLAWYLFLLFFAKKIERFWAMTNKLVHDRVACSKNLTIPYLSNETSSSTSGISLNSIDDRLDHFRLLGLSCSVRILVERTINHFSESNVSSCALWIKRWDDDNEVLASSLGCGWLTMIVTISTFVADHIPLSRRERTW